MTELTDKIKAFWYLNKNLSENDIEAAIKRFEPTLILAIAQLLGYETIYGDTDSITLTPPDPKKKFTINF